MWWSTTYEPALRNASGVCSGWTAEERQPRLAHGRKMLEALDGLALETEAPSRGRSRRSSSNTRTRARERRAAPATSPPPSASDDPPPPPPSAMLRRSIVQLAAAVRRAEQAGDWTTAVALASSAHELARRVHGLASEGSSMRAHR